MAALTLPQVGVYGLLTAATNLKNIVDGLEGVSLLRNIADDAETTGFEIEQALSEGRVPPRDTLERVRMIERAFQEAKEQIDDALAHSAHSCELLLGLQVREPNGDTIEPARASSDAVSECIYGAPEASSEGLI